MKFKYSVVTLFIIYFFIPITTEDKVKPNKIPRVPKVIEDYELSKISNLSNIKNLNDIIDNILIPRVVGTSGHSQVQIYIKNSMSNLGWQVESDSFKDKTPNMGVLTFENIIATLNPKADRYLILACHYDSKYFPDNKDFVGAIDSAIPCAMLINMAVVLKTYLEQNKETTDVSLKFVFFDGEEAFLEWSDLDSIYGARHLAAKWENEKFLQKIETLMLLDLLGVPDPTFFSYFSDTQELYVRLCDHEDRLANAGLLERYTHSSAITRTQNAYFQRRSFGSFIQDDHIPFWERGVPILHLIPTPFPSVWHKPTDDLDAIDISTVENLNKILRMFIIEYLNLNV